MQSLLRWGIENSTPQNTNAAPARRTDLNPEIIDLLLGKSDAELMKEALSTAVDDAQSEEDRVSALDNMEMLIEQIDNANNLENLHMWDPLHALLTSSPDSVTVQTLWVIGTALQNNPSAQDAYLKLNPLPTLTAFLSPPTPNVNSKPPRPSPSKHLRSKAIYALSGLLKHNAPALLQLSATHDAHGRDGWDTLSLALQDPDITVRRKTLFLLNALLISDPASPSTAPGSLHSPTPIHPNSHAVHLAHPSRASTSAPTLDALRTHGIIDALIDGLTQPLPHGEDGDNEELDPEFEELGVALLNTYLTLTQTQTLTQQPTPPLDQTQKTRLREWISTFSSPHQTPGADDANTDELAPKLAERWGMGIGEVEGFLRMVG
ncbi:Le.MFB2 [Lentinula aff. lateritia]|uniref:Le.MFB2 n=1 Tax=Lentinula aff. lateritia TaxID=2804960 RepID=A0ACC1TVM2_9AGAR|nr:Le.MFB2 [Lentinula aff. lateritia]